MSFASKTLTTLASAFILLGATVIDKAIDTHLLVPASALAADNVTIEDISFTGETASLEIPRAIVNGTSLTETELAAIFDQKSKKPIAERLSALSAASIIIPELILTHEVDDATQVITYYNVELHNVSNGVIGKATSARSAITSTIDEEDEETEVLSGSIGSISIDSIDTAFTARLLTEADSSELRKTQKVHGPFSINDYHIVAFSDEEANDDGLTLSIKNIKGAGLSARMGHSPFLNIIGLANVSDSEFEGLPAEQKRAVLRGLSDIFSSFDVGETIASGIMITDANEDTSKSKYAMRIGSIGTLYDDQKLRLVFDDISFINKSETGKDNTASIKHFGLEELSFKPTIAALNEASKADLKNNKSPLDGVALAPTGGKLAIEGINVDYDIGNSTAEDIAENATQTNTDTIVPNAPERLTFSLKAFNTMLGTDLTNGIAHFHTTLTDLQVPLVHLRDMSGMQELRDMGYTDLTFSSVFKGEWNEAKQQVTIDTLSFSGQGIGSINASARFGNVTKEALSNNIDAVFAALDQASLHEVSLTIENGGLFERIVKQQSKSGAGTEDEIKQQYAALATVGIPALIGDTATARKLATAVSRFANSQRKLSITATAKDPKGVPVNSLDLGNAEPGSLLERFDITTAE